MSQVSLGSVLMTAEAREQNEEESVKRTVALLANFSHFILPGWRIRALLPMTRVGLRWKSLKRQESVEAGAGWKRSNMSLSYSEVKPFLFFCNHSPHLLPLSSSVELTPPSHFFKKLEVLMQHHLHHHLHRHHRDYPHCHRLFGNTHSSFTFNWQLEVVSKVICLSPVRQPPPPPLLWFFLSRVIAAWCE